jgi:acetylglutamate kinase
MGDATSMERFARDIVLMKQCGVQPVVVHGGGPQIGQMLERLQIKSEFVDGLRVTCADTVEVVEMVLSGAINKRIVAAINAQGGKAVGLSGKDANLIVCEKALKRKKDPESNIEKVLDLGFVGEPVEVNPRVLEVFLESDFIPVVAPVGAGRTADETFNINADTAAGAVAGAMNAARLMLLTDVQGVMDKEGEVLTRLTRADIQRLIADGTIAGGMIPKVETALYGIEKGVEAAVILDGRTPHGVLLELFTQHGAGTLISA